VLDAHAEPWGIMRLPASGFVGAFDGVAAAWRATHPHAQAIACGMVGSAQGWVRAAYVPCPAGVDALAERLAAVPERGLHVVPGLTSAADPPDVMRGEETQIVGALALRPALSAASCVVLPGTHSKWARVVESNVVDFATFMTGELFAVLRDHSLLGRPARDAATTVDTATADDAFARGVRLAFDAAHGVAPLLFSARTAVLAERLDPAASLHYLSGLLVGDELRVGLARYGAPDALVGDPALCERYATALRTVDRPSVPVLDGAAPAGLWRVAECAGLVTDA